jgi:RNA polymerase sigma factor (sigma-70 family)
MPEPDPNPAAGTGSRQFATTHWSAVQRAGDSQSPGSTAALEELCRAYWFPIYAFVRARGQGPEEARDLTQEFFARLLEKKWLAQADPERGRFRSFLLACCKNFLVNEWRHAHRLKRGAGCTFSLDELDAEQRYQVAPADNSSPEKIFDRRWAAALLARVLERLQMECDDDGAQRARRFEVLKVFLLEEKGALSFNDAAAELGLSVVATKGIVHRLRQRYRQIFREEISDTVSRPEDVEDETRHLFQALAEGNPGGG